MFVQRSQKLTGSIITALCLLAAPAVKADQFDGMVNLGKFLFNDRALSKPVGQSCASCHSPSTGFTSPRHAINKFGAVVHGAVARRAGNRKPPTVAYVTFSENFSVENGRPGGGTFWDGRATGEAVTADIFPSHWDPQLSAIFATLLGPAVDQAMGPLLNDVEQNLDSPMQLCNRIRTSMPFGMWFAAWNEPLTCQPAVAELVHKRAAFAIAMFESSPEVNAFSSKWDWAADLAMAEHGEVAAPLTLFNDQENLGFALYQANCTSGCHIGKVVQNDIERELFTKPRARFANIGVPRNEDNPFYGMDRLTNDNGDIINPQGVMWTDLGVAGRDEDGIPGSDFVGREGHFKTPTLRNVGKKPGPHFIKAYTHNGYFKSLENLVHFYNTRDMKQSCEEMFNLSVDPANPMTLSDAEAMVFDCWPTAEVQETLTNCDDASNHCKVTLLAGQSYDSYCDSPESKRDLGNFCMTEEDEAALVAFLHTLTD